MTSQVSTALCASFPCEANAYSGPDVHRPENRRLTDKAGGVGGARQYHITEIDPFFAANA